MNRRRFLALSAAALCPVTALAADWQGTGLGTSLSLRLVGGTPAQTRHAFRRVELELAHIEATASLYRDSTLTRLNRDGHLAEPSADFLNLLTLADQIHHATAGAFDPTVQPLWLAIAKDTDQTAARQNIGWTRVTLGPDEIRLAPGQALTLNGIAQGWAADRIAIILREEGFANALIDMGETQALGLREDGQPWQARITTPTGQPLADIPLTNRALATSSPKGTLIGMGHPHILGPKGQAAKWQTVSVSAQTAAVADALSTAFTLMDRPSIDAALALFPEAKLETIA